MKNILNYISSLKIKQNEKELIFSKCKISIISSEISNKTDNIFNSTIINKRGYKISSDITIYIMNDEEKSLFDNLLLIIFNLDMNNKLTIDILNKSELVLRAFDFDILENSLDYNKFLNNNFNIGNEINIKLSSGLIYPVLPEFWIDEAYSNELNENTYLEDLVL